MELPSRQIFSVSQLTQEIKNILENNFYYVWVEGEISNTRSPISGHIYFTLKDEGAQVKAVIFRGQSRGIKFKSKFSARLKLSKSCSEAVRYF